MGSTSNRGLSRIGGFSAILSTVFLAAGLILAISFGVSPDASAETILKQVHEKRNIYAMFEGSFLLSALFLIPLIPALYQALKESSRSLVLTAASLAGAGALSLIADNTIGYALFRLSERYVSTIEAEHRAAIVVGDAVLASSRVAFDAALLLLGAATILVGVVMLRAHHPKWLGALGIITGLAAVLGGILLPLFFFTSLPSTILYVLWLASVGVWLFRH